MSVEDRIIFKKAKDVVEKFEKILEESGFEFFIEGENMFLRTIDNNNVYRLYDKSVGGNAMLRNSITLLPRTTDSQDLIPMLLNGKELEWK